MKTKEQLRKKFLILRKKKYFDVSHDKFYQLSNYLKNSKFTLLMPRIKEGNLLKFVKWNESDILVVNKFGIPEPIKTKKSYLPDILLVPLLAFDKKNNRLGYGKGFYDRYLNDLSKFNKKIEAIGVAFSFQKHKKLPSTKFDFKLNNIFTEKGFIK